MEYVGPLRYACRTRPGVGMMPKRACNARRSGNTSTPLLPLSPSGFATTGKEQSGQGAGAGMPSSRKRESDVDLEEETA